MDNLFLSVYLSEMTLIVNVYVYSQNNNRMQCRENDDVNSLTLIIHICIIYVREHIIQYIRR